MVEFGNVFLPSPVDSILLATFIVSPVDEYSWEISVLQLKKFLINFELISVSLPNRQYLGIFDPTIPVCAPKLKSDIYDMNLI